MTAQARHIVFRTSKADATPADVERWAAERGCIVANIRQIPTTSYIEFEGKMLRPDDQIHVWTGDIVISEGIE